MLLCRSWMFSATVTRPTVLMASETQQFAWCECDVEPLTKARACCASEPMFCFETALRAMFWTVAAYRETRDEHSEATFTVANGAQVDGLEHHQIVTCPERDIAMLCAYGPGLVVVSFRGTVSMKKCVHWFSLPSTVSYTQCVLGCCSMANAPRSG